jgi:hypothetical protein
MITKEEIELAATTYADNECSAWTNDFVGFVTGVEWLMQKLQPCKVAYSLPSLTESKTLELILSKFHGHTKEYWENELVEKYPYCEIPYLVRMVWDAAQTKEAINKEEVKEPVVKSLQDCKEEWSANYNKTWEEVRRDFDYAMGWTKMFSFEEVMDMVAELYAKTKLKNE